MIALVFLKFCAKCLHKAILTDAHIEQIMQVFASKEDVAHLAKSVTFETVVANNYNLSVRSYVEAKENREIIDIAELNAELKTTVSKIDQLRKDIDAIVAEIEGCEVQKCLPEAGDLHVAVHCHSWSAGNGRKP